MVGETHVLTGDATAGYAVDWTGRFRGHAAAVLRPTITVTGSAGLGTSWIRAAVITASVPSDPASRPG